MIGDSYRAKIESHVEDARSRGAQILTGGRRPRDLAKGWFYEPTVLTGVDHSMLIMREETFGPALPLMEYTSFEEAIDLVNDSPYGLGAVLLSEDPRKIKTFFEDVKAGTIWINDPLTDNYAGPFGGMKYSGGARELGIEGLDEFRETKHVHWDFHLEDKSYWYPYGKE
jgi:betaine-aldehyde dehydrogenase